MIPEVKWKYKGHTCWIQKEIEHDEDNAKCSHYVTTPEGTELEPDISPYDETCATVNLWIDCSYPERGTRVAPWDAESLLVLKAALQVEQAPTPVDVPLTHGEGDDERVVINMPISELAALVCLSRMGGQLWAGVRAGVQHPKLIADINKFFNNNGVTDIKEQVEIVDGMMHTVVPKYEQMYQMLTAPKPTEKGDD